MLYLAPDINRKTGHRIKYAKVDADTGEETNEDIMKGYKVDTDTYVEVSKDELENIALESTRTIDIDEFVPKSDIDPRYLIRPYYLVPDGKVGHDTFAMIRETIRNMNMVAIGRLVLTNREHIIALEPLATAPKKIVQPKSGICKQRPPRPQDARLFALSGTSADRGAHTANAGPIPWPGVRHRASGMTSRLRGMRGRRLPGRNGQPYS